MSARAKSDFTIARESAATSMSKLMASIDAYRLTASRIGTVDVSKLMAGLDTSKLMAERIAAMDVSKLVAGLDTSKLMADRIAAVDLSKLVASLDTSKLMADRIAAVDVSKLMAGLDTSKLMADRIAAFDVSKAMADVDATRLLRASLRAIQEYRVPTPQFDWPTIIVRRSPGVTPRAEPVVPATLPEPREARIIRARFARYLEGREPVGSMAYAILTLLEKAAGDRPQAARFFGVSRNVLQLLAFLSTEVGDELTVRKFSGKSPLRPHTKQEVEWIEKLIGLLPSRIAEVTEGDFTYVISMDILPPME